MSEIIIDKDELEFHYKVGTLIACDIAKDYAGSLGTMYKEKGDNYRHNKCLAVEKANEKLMDDISRDIKAILPHVKEFVEDNMNLIYDTVALTQDNQRRVYGLVKKLKAEQDAKN